MSGLFGIVRLDGAAVAEDDLRRPMRALAHLGPDGREVWRDGPVGLGALSMRLVREDAFDRQPLIDDTRGLALVCDARLDNREALADMLAIDHARLDRMADSAMLFEAFKAWGPACAERLVGDFAFAAWEAGPRTLTLGRDHMGQRQIFFHLGEGFFAFASERKGLWALPDVPRRMPDQPLARMLGEPPAGGFVASPPDGVGIAPGGSIVTLEANGRLTATRYWAPRPDPAHQGRDEAYYLEAYRRVLSEAVACRVRRAIQPPGLFLSGGFDSAAIAALAGSELAGRGRKLIAAASVMPEAYRGSIRHARSWVELCRRDMPHLEVRYVTRDGLDIFTNLERGFLGRDTAVSPNAYVTDALFSEISAAGGRVVMDGFGGDYTLNPRPASYLLGLLGEGRLRRFGSEWKARRRFLGLSSWDVFKSELVHPAVPGLSARWRRIRNGLPPIGPTRPLVRGRNRAAARPGAQRAPFGPRGLQPGMRRALEAQQDAARSVAAAMHGLKLTQPYLDKRVVELALAIPPDLYVRAGRDRHLARSALKDLLPPEFQHRAAPNDDWTPDFLAMVKRVEPRILAEIDRMAQSGKLADLFDFPRMRRMLTQRRLERGRSGHEYDTGQAVAAFLLGRYIEWFEGDNA